jgi:hypothetical protein
MNIKTFLHDAKIGQFDVLQYIKEPEIKDEKLPEQPVYVYETMNKVKRIALGIILGILSIIFLPYGIYQLIHLLGGLAIVPAQLFKLLPEYQVDHEEFTNELKAVLTARPNLVAKRISVEVDGTKVDAMILGKKENLENGRWALFSNGNGGTLENVLYLHHDKFIDQIEELDTNYLIYNYQGVGKSEGWATRDGMVNAHKAMLQFLEDTQKGVGAKEILQWGLSIGGGVQGHAMKTHQMKEGIKYVFIKNQTFSEISKVPGVLLGLLIKIFGWEFETIESSNKMEEEGKPEIILQTAHKFEKLKADDILHDGTISKESAQAYALLNIKGKWQHKKFIGLKGGHCEGFWKEESQKIYAMIKKALQPTYVGFHKNFTAVAI